MSLVDEGESNVNPRVEALARELRRLEMKRADLLRDDGWEASPWEELDDELRVPYRAEAARLIDIADAPLVEQIKRSSARPCL